MSVRLHTCNTSSDRLYHTIFGGVLSLVPVNNAHHEFKRFELLYFRLELIPFLFVLLPLIFPFINFFLFKGK